MKTINYFISLMLLGLIISCNYSENNKPHSKLEDLYKNEKLDNIANENVTKVLDPETYELLEKIKKTYPDIWISDSFKIVNGQMELVLPSFEEMIKEGCVGYHVIVFPVDKKISFNFSFGQAYSCNGEIFERNGSLIRESECYGIDGPTGNIEKFVDGKKVSDSKDYISSIQSNSPTKITKFQSTSDVCKYLENKHWAPDLNSKGYLEIDCFSGLIVNGEYRSFALKVNVESSTVATLEGYLASEGTPFTITVNCSDHTLYLGTTTYYIKK